jgi:hypothetical protein
MRDTVLIILGSIVLIIVITAVWLIPRGVCDLYIALAAGRDVLAGNLSQPDEWSFSTDGKVWINQNWGAGAILYTAYLFGGEAALLIVKYLLVAFIGVFLIIALHQHKISLPLCLLSAAFCIAVINVYAILRPNLFSFVLMPLYLWLLYKSLTQSRFVWLTLPVILVWANLHGGFLFGLGMLWLHTGCILIPSLIKEKGKALKKHWQLPAASLAALLVTGLVNPFGIRNLTHPLLMGQGSLWNITTDWQPLWKTELLERFMVSITGFLIILAITLLLLLIRFLFVVKKSKKQRNTFSYDHIFFDGILAAVAMVMAILSNRFVAFAVLALAPILAHQLQWITREFRRGWLIIPAGLTLVLIFSILLIFDNFRTYNPKNPLQNTGEGTFFEKMHYTNMAYDQELVNFINANNITGPVFSPWIWEGFLRLKAPQMKPFIGGRAQQVYTIEAFIKYLHLTGNTNSSYNINTAKDTLNNLGVHYLITGHSQSNYNLIYAALSGNNWVIIYADSRFLLFANMDVPAAANISDQLWEGHLTFETKGAQTMSMAGYILSQPNRWDQDNLATLFKEAYTHENLWLWSYMMLFTHTQGNEILFQQIIGLLDEQLEKLETMSLDTHDAMILEILECRIYIAESLANCAKYFDRPDIEETRNKSKEAAKKLWSEIISQWKPLIMNY